MGRQDFTINGIAYERYEYTAEELSKKGIKLFDSKKCEIEPLKIIAELKLELSTFYFIRGGRDYVNFVSFLYDIASVVVLEGKNTRVESLTSLQLIGKVLRVENIEKSRKDGEPRYALYVFDVDEL